MRALLLVSALAAADDSLLRRADAAAHEQASVTGVAVERPAGRSRSYSSDGSLVRDFDPSLQLAGSPFWARYWDGSAVLSFVAAKHGNHRATFAIIEQELADVAPAAVIIEGVRKGGGEPPPGEPTHAARLAGRRGARVIGGEPTPAQELSGVLKEECSPGRKCTLFDFQGFYTIRTLAGQRGDQPTIAKIAAEFAQEFGAPEKLLMKEAAFRRWYREGNGREFPEDPAQVDPQDSYPKADARELSRRVAAADARARNRVLAKRIASQLSLPPHRVVVVYGAGHHTELRLELEALLGPHRCAGNDPTDRRGCRPRR